ncbi:MAG: PilW family protein [Alloalcanivorax sp.]
MRAAQKGFSLVELMVALVLGLIVTAAAIQLFITNQKTFVLQQTASQLQQDSQQVMRFMIRDLRKAGLIWDTVTATRDMGIQFSNWSGEIPASAEGTDNDRLTLAYNGKSDCAGNTVTDWTEVATTYYVDDGSLYCKGSLDTDVVVELVPGVESFQVLYGIDTNNDGALGVSRYVTQDQVPADIPVVAVKIGLLLTRANNALPESDGTREFHILGETLTEPADRAMRKALSTTVRLRNYDWDAI